MIIDHDNREPQTYRILNNAPFEAYIKIVKKDADTDEIITFDYASFQLHDEQGNIVTQKVGNDYIDTFTTDESGMVTTPLKIKAGTYYIHEVKTPKGYITMHEPVEVVIKNEGAVEIDSDGDPVIIITIYNEKPTGEIEIIKEFEQLEELDTIYAKFQLQANVDILNPINGDVLYYKDDIIANPNSADGLYVTDNDLTIHIDRLPLSTESAEYRIVEIETLSQYQLAEDVIIIFELTDNHTREYKQSIVVFNEITEVIIRKEDEQTKELLSDAKLGVYNQNNELVSEWVSIDTPHTIKGLHRNQEYILHEKEAPIGYLVAEDLAFTVEDRTITMFDLPILTDIEVVKIDANTKEVIKGKDFAFTLYEDENCTKEIVTLDADTTLGNVMFHDLRYGEVFIKETKSPSGYQISDEVVRIEIDDTLDLVDNIHRVVYENTPNTTLQTGDSNYLIVIGIISIISLIGVLYFLYRIKSL